jgi:hypothetical protein
MLWLCGGESDAAAYLVHFMLLCFAWFWCYSRLVFEDRLGLGILLGSSQSIEIGYRLVHYSNAYLAQKNQGLNLHLLIIGYWFN